MNEQNTYDFAFEFLSQGIWDSEDFSRFMDAEKQASYKQGSDHGYEYGYSNGYSDGRYDYDDGAQFL